MNRRVVVALAALTLFATAAHAGMISDPNAAGFTPRFPVSAFTQPAAWFDPSQLHFASTFSVGSGWGSGTNALQTTSFSYQFKAPMWMSVSVGNAFGPDAARGSSVFLQGLDFAWKPSGNSLIRVAFQNVRSPLQYGMYSPYEARPMLMSDPAPRGY